MPSSWRTSNATNYAGHAAAPRAGGGPVLHPLERQPVRSDVPDEELAVEDRATGQLLLGGCDQVRLQCERSKSLTPRGLR
ncbi:hypothetical protein [Streptomyces sp. NPDC086989]|uniref:hypothetical protein n=1 Tax=Streptomyces sp. NPDC086989 TaxID=3365764 RepID=UPI003820B864